MRDLVVALVILTLAPGPGAAVAADEADRAIGAFLPAGEMAEGRAYQTATLIPDGRVLVVGGDGDPPSLLELWDPVTRRFAPHGTLEVGRAGHTATLLRDGHVLVVGGGCCGPGAARSALVVDPETGAGTPTGALPRGRSGHTATLLDDGRVLVVGGYGYASALLWDPATGAFTRAGTMQAVRVGHTATLLEDGRVLVVGGSDRSDNHRLAGAEIWDPTTETFGPTGSLPRGRADHAAALRPDGQVLVFGGIDSRNRHVMGVQRWDPETGAFRSAGKMPPSCTNGTPVPLPDGRILMAGGHDGWGHTRDSTIWDPDVRTCVPTGSLGHARGPHSATPLLDGRVLLLGGYDDDGRPVGNAEVWDPAATPPAWQPSAADATPEQVREDLRATLPRPLDCRDYEVGDVANDPFAYGAIGAILCAPIAAERFPWSDAIEQSTLFRFPDRESMSGYWAFRRTQNPNMRRREDACVDGGRGYGTWTHGRYLCYVSKVSGHALLRWTDVRTDTYGVLDSNGDQVVPLYRAWIESRP